MNALDILQAGLANVGVAHAIATAENNKGFAQGVKAGTGKGVLMTLDCAKKRFGSKLFGLLAGEVERRHGEELMG